MLEKLTRYHHKQIVNHLASHYVLGLLSARVSARVETLQRNNKPLAQQIRLWQQQLSFFDRQCEALPPESETWQAIEQHISKIKVVKKSTTNTKKFVIVVSLVLGLSLIGLFFANLIL